MYFLTKIFRIPIGHRLSKHIGRCRNSHGHNIQIDVTVLSNILNENDMVIDFSILKRIVSEYLDKFDHTYLLNKDDIDEITHCKKMNMRYKTFIGDPTAEILAKYIFTNINICLKCDSTTQEISCYSIKIWENNDSCVEYRN